MTKGAGHWLAGRWFGKDEADAYEIDGDDHGGVVAKSGRWFTEAWWDGHWLKRTRCGEWRPAGFDGLEACHRRKGHSGEHTYSTPSLARARAAAVPDDMLYGKGATDARRRRFNPNGHQALARDYRAYLEARLDDAERDTRGNLLTPAGRVRGLDARHFFSGRKASSKYATEELRDWLRENGANLSASEFRAQAAGAGGRRPTFDSVGVPY